MLDYFRVLVPDRIYVQARNGKELEKLILDYMQRYPHYVFLYEENGFAICERKTVEKDGEHE